jgi:hypothetical protein
MINQKCFIITAIRYKKDKILLSGLKDEYFIAYSDETV